MRYPIDPHLYSPDIETVHMQLALGKWLRITDNREIEKDQRYPPHL